MSKVAAENFEPISDYTFKLYNSITEINLDDWNKVCQNSSENIFMDPRFISAAETTMRQTCKFWHIIFYDNNELPVACTSLCLFRMDMLIVAGKYFKKAGNSLRSIFPSMMYATILFCGLPVSVGQSHLRFSPDVDHKSIIKALDKILHDFAIIEKARFIIYKEFNSDSCKVMDSLLELGYRKVESLPLHFFKRKFPDFAGYCSELKSHYRYDIKRSKRKFESAGLKVVRLKDVNEIQKMYTPKVHKLYEAVVAHSESKLEILPLEFFHELARQFPDQISFTLIYQGNQIIAFNCALYSNTSYYFLFCGLNYKLNHSTDLYFNLIYSDLDNAFKQDVSEIQVGQTADVFKARLGCVQKPLYVYIKSVGRFSRWVLKLLFNLIFPEQKGIEANDVFKSAN